MNRISPINRGYANLSECLTKLGAHVEAVE